MEHIAEELLKNKVVGIRKVQNKCVAYLHWHRKYELVILKNKPCRFKINDECICADVGDIIAIDEYSIHQFLIDEDDTELVVIQFQMSLFIDAQVPLKPLENHITYDEIKKIPGLEEKINALAGMFESEKPVRDGEDNPFLRSVAMSLYYLLMRHFPDEKNNNDSVEDKEDFYKIIEFINENFCDRINLNIIAEKMFMSRWKITKLFQKYSGVSINEYITVNRIKKVNHLIMRGYDVTTAAFESGFQSIRTFNEVYKKHMGITPSEYKQNKEAL